jgi:DNA polymerase III gamma/tau subunit
MSISTLIYGSNSESRLEEIKKSLPNFKWEHNPDLKVIERIKTKKSVGIEEVRPVSNFLKIKPLGKLKVVIINEANLLTTEAQNSLLKILE